MEGEPMKRITTSIAAAISLTFLSLAIPTVASAQTAQAVRTAHIHSTSDAPSDYVRYCVSAIEDAVRDATVDRVLDKVLHLPNAAKAYDIYTTGSDEAQLKYELNHKQYLSAPFSASRVLYDFLGQLPDTGAFWSIGTPATSCLEAAVAWDLQTGAQIGTQLRKDLEKYLSSLLPAAPTSLSVRADPSDGTVLLLTWHANETSLLASLLNPGFEVNNGVESRSAPAHPATGTVTYTWHGLKPGSWTCFRVRATNALGDSAWAPKPGSGYNGSDYECAFSSSPRPTANKCVFLEPNQVNCTSSNPQITLESENIGDTSGCTFSAQITWGDGSQQTVQYPGANNQPKAIANHTYQKKGTFSITVNPTVLSGGCSSFSGNYKFTYS
jgi:hypothetical protein